MGSLQRRSFRCVLLNERMRAASVDLCFANVSGEVGQRCDCTQCPTLAIIGRQEAARGGQNLVLVALQTLLHGALAVLAALSTALSGSTLHFGISCLGGRCALM